MTKRRWTAADLPDMAGRTVLVTGASGGLGLIISREFARVGARVVMTVRDLERGRAVAERITGEVEVRRLDVSELAEVRAFASAWSGPVDVLVHSAAAFGGPVDRTAEGFDRQTATNAWGPFALTKLLLPAVTDRVVWASSQLHRWGQVRWGDLTWRRHRYRPMAAYLDSKLYVVLFSAELQRRLRRADASVRSVVAHPGMVATAAVAGTPVRLLNRFPRLLNDVRRGALPMLYAATEDVPGNAYIGPDGPAGFKGHPASGRPSRTGRDSAVARRLWRSAASLTGLPAAIRV